MAECACMITGYSQMAFQARRKLDSNLATDAAFVWLHNEYVRSAYPGLRQPPQVHLLHARARAPAASPDYVFLDSRYVP
eukprot:6173632-Pleurochrysis_carterae.AAC.3